MGLALYAFTLQKRGAAPEENEDAIALSDLAPNRWYRIASSRTTHMALSDGASEGMLSSQWSRCLANTYAKTSENPHSVLRSALETWPRSVEEYIRGREAEGRALAWFEEEAINRGARATLLAVSVRTAAKGKAGGSVRAIAVGDTNLFLIRAGRLACSFPVARSEDFGNSPDLVPTSAARWVESKLKSTQMQLKEHDKLVLATDAFSCWFLKEVESRRRPWTEIEKRLRAPEPRLATWIESLREGGALKNDDVSVVYAVCS